VRMAGGFCQQLRLAGAVHSDEPPNGFVNALAHSKQAVIAQDSCLLIAKRVGDAIAFGGFFDDAGVIVEHNVVLVKRASVLRERIEQPSERRPRFAEKRMGMSGGDDVWAGFVNARVNHKRCEVDFAVAFDDLPLVIDQHEVGSTNLAKSATANAQAIFLEND